MSRRSSTRILLFGLVIMTMILSACAPAATPTQAPAAAATNTEAPAVPTAAPSNTVAPTVAPTEAPKATEPPAATATTAPEATATIPAAVCEPMANLPTVKAGELGSEDKPIVITFVPSGEAGKITKAGTAIADCLSKMTGLAFEIEVGTSYAASIEAMGANKAQVGFLNTFSILLAEEKYQIVPVIGNLRKYNTNAIDPDKG